MSETNYTKGEWEFDEEKFSVSAEEKEICVIDLWATHLNTSKRRANGHLLAASKELLKACEFAMNLVKLSEAFDLNLGKGWQEFKTLAEPAIEKATKQ